MEDRKFKLGDKVVIRTGLYQGREGHVVGITAQASGPDIISVRLYADPADTATVGPDDLRHAD
jgi:hypothetical protein